MQIKRLVIENFKSIERIELVEPNPFTVFVGPNGSGKSNIFEALEFVSLNFRYGRDEALSLVGGIEKIKRRQILGSLYEIELSLSDFIININPGRASEDRVASDIYSTPIGKIEGPLSSIDVMQASRRFTRLFVGNDRLVKLNYTDDKRLTVSASNMETVLKRLLTDDTLSDEIHEWLALFIPGFTKVEVVSGTFDSKDTLLVYEQTVEKPFTKDLISDGTYNIIALLTAVYQSDEPQFLCIEEPENGLHPEVLESLIGFFRKQCEEKGHYIWLNTHSESIVKLLTTDEIVLVNKRDGATQTKQVKGMNTYSLTTDQAWLSGALGGGLAW